MTAGTTTVCEHCKGAVDVVCFNGQKVRCGCGKTMVALPAVHPPEPEPQVATLTPEALRAFCRVLREEGVASFRAGDVQIEMGALPAPVEEAPKSDKPIASLDSTELCACGHYLHDHTEGGCIHGCPDEPCEKWAGQKGGRA